MVRSGFPIRSAGIGRVETLLRSLLLLAPDRTSLTSSGLETMGSCISSYGVGVAISLVTRAIFHLGIRRIRMGVSRCWCSRSYDCARRTQYQSRGRKEGASMNTGYR